MATIVQSTGTTGTTGDGDGTTHGATDGTGMTGSGIPGVGDGDGTTRGTTDITVHIITTGEDGTGLTMTTDDIATTGLALTIPEEVVSTREEA